MDERIQRYAKPYQLTTNKETTPLSFKNWIRQNYGVIPSNAEKQYREYLLQWYQTQNETQIDNASKVTNDYIDLIASLKKLFKNDKQFERIVNIDPEDTVQLSIAIPYFAQKLKELAIYYVEKREELKTAKIQRNLKGSAQGIDIILKSKLLKRFTKNEVNSLAYDFELSEIPELSSIAANMEIDVEELYDFTDYSLSANSTAIETVSDNPLFYILADYISVVYNAFSLEEVPLSAKEVPYDQIDQCLSNTAINRENLAKLNEKYLGENYSYILGGYYTTAYDDVVWNLAQGNNVFYFPTEELKGNKYAEITLNDLNLTPTFSLQLSGSDLIFVENGDTLEGAWYGIKAEILTADFVATIQAGKEFKYPFPGIGLVNTENQWTGPELDDNANKVATFFPTKNETLNAQKMAETIYWSTDFSLSAVDDISIHDTTLIESGAYANFKFKNADKIVLNDVEYAWLYDIQKTQLPIKADDNFLYFPIQRYENVSKILIKYPKTGEISLRNLNVNDCFLGAVASNIIDEADLIVSLDSFGQELSSAAWLYSAPLDYKADKICNCEYDSPYVIQTNIDAVYKTIDAHIILDRSGSMRNKNGGTKTKYDIAREAIMNFASQATVNNIRLTIFAADCDDKHTSRWFNVKSASDMAEFNTFLYTYDVIPLTGKLGTNYIAALNNVRRNWSLPAINGDLRNIYFISDGAPNPLSQRITPTRETEWQAFLVTNGITNCYSINVPGSSYTDAQIQEYLEAVAYPQTDNPFLDNDTNNVIILDDVNDLIQILYKTNVIEQEAQVIIDERPVIDKVYYTGMTYTAGAKQPALNFTAQKGEVRKFVWDGTSSDINTIREFLGFSHEPYCNYLQQESDSIVPLNDKDSYGNTWKTCDCHAVHRSPLGHKGSNFFDNYAYSDYIVFDNMPDFDPITWRGRDGKGIGESRDFAWFKLDSDENDSLAGWGKGQWLDGAGEVFVFHMGELYNYIRNDLPDSTITELPYFVINHPYCDQSHAYWKKAIKDPATKNWIDSGSRADMKLKYGEKYRYLHRATNNFVTRRFTLNNEYVNEEYVEFAPTDGVVSYKEIQYTNPSTNFLITIDTEDATPFWSNASPNPDMHQIIMPKERSIVFDYVQHVQPEFSKMFFKTNDKIRYDRGDCSNVCFQWRQPVEIKISNPNIEGTWYKLDIDRCYQSLIIDHLLNGKCTKCNKPYDASNEGACDSCYKELPTFFKEIIFGNCGCDANICEPTVTVVNPTYELSDISINKDKKSEQFKISYIARNGFTHSFQAANINNGLEGLWVDEVRGSYLNASEPWKNLLNTDYAVIAQSSSTDKLVSKNEIGLDIPSHMGLGKYEIRKGKIEFINAENTDNIKLFRNYKYYLDEGFELTHLDSSWMKIQTGQAKGQIIPTDYKRFTAYTCDISDIVQNSDYVQKSLTDVFGNRYLLLKNDAGTIFNKRKISGRLYIKTWDNNIYTMEEFHPDFITKLQTFDRTVTGTVETYDQDLSTYSLTTYEELFSPVSEITSNSITNIDVFYDMIGIETPNFYTLFRNIENLNSERESEYNTLYVFEKNHFNHWFDTKTNQIWFLNINQYPTIWKYKINQNTLTIVYEDSSDWSFEHLPHSRPHFQIDKNHLYLSFITEMTGLSSDVMVIGDFTDIDENTLTLDSLKGLTGDDFGNKQILEFGMKNDKPIIVLEVQADPNEIEFFEIEI